MKSLTRTTQASPDDPAPLHTVLVVEDELLVRLPIAEYLRDCGYQVVEACDAAEAIAVVNDIGPVSVVFTDVRMPGKMDGFDLARWFQANYPGTPVLLTSGFNNSRQAYSASPFGGRLIEKPYSQIHVAKRIAALLDG